jgi:putative membrane protein
MYTKKVFPVTGMIAWTFKYIILFLVISIIPVFLFDILDWKWLHLPWLPIGLLGTAVAFIQGFKNSASYDRLWEARKIWGGIVNTSRTWTIMIKDFITNDHASDKLSSAELKFIVKEIIMRHVAWLTAFRYQMRQPKPWEVNVHSKKHTKFRKKNYALLESDISKDQAILPYLSSTDLKAISGKGNWASQILGLQSSHIKELKDRGLIEDFRHMELMNILKELYTLQGKSERIKNFPYPRQFATLNLYFIWIFIVLLPFGVMDAFHDIGIGFIEEVMEHEHEAGFFHMVFDALGKHFVWLSVPFSALISWVFYTLEMIGENTENPFEGGVNDVPITNMTRGIEIDIRQLIDDDGIPEAYVWDNSIVL